MMDKTRRAIKIVGPTEQETKRRIITSAIERYGQDAERQKQQTQEPMTFSEAMKLCWERGEATEEQMRKWAPEHLHGAKQNGEEQSEW